jgi:hypothetical protein
MSHLAPCPACNRHVDVVETACPFCAAALPDALRGRLTPQPARRLSRAAMMAAGATLIGAGACSNDDAIGNKPGTDAAVDRPVLATDAHRPVPVPVYGSPPISLGTGGTLGTGGAGGKDGSDGATDAGNDAATDAPPARDAAQDRSIIAIYGAAFAGGLTSDKPES